MLKSGGAALVTNPGDVIHILETPARHAVAGTHAARYLQPGIFDPPESGGSSPSPAPDSKPAPKLGLSPGQAAILAALDAPKTRDELAALTGLDAQSLSAELTMLELQSRVRRVGSRVGRSG